MSSISLFRFVAAIDALLLSLPSAAQLGCVAVAMAVCVGIGIRYVPRPFMDYSATILSGIRQPETYGRDTIADLFESKVILDDPSAMYTKDRLSQTPLEAATWSKAASSPYPPAALLTMAALYSLGGRTGPGFYGCMLVLACIFLTASAVYCLQTRWYLFPLMCLNASYIAERFVYVQDDTYLLMLVVLMAALFLARARQPQCDVLMAIAITIKLSPLYYLRNVVRVKRSRAVAMIAIVVLGLGLPYVLWTNYGYIYQFQIHRKGHYWLNAAAAMLLVGPLTTLLAYVEARLDFDLEDRVGWSVVPFALFMALTINAARHLFIMLLIPDKRGLRTAAGSIGFALHYIVPREGATVYAMAALLGSVLTYHLCLIGWETIRDDLRHPLRSAVLVSRGGNTCTA